MKYSEVKANENAMQYCMVLKTHVRCVLTFYTTKKEKPVTWNMSGIDCEVYLDFRDAKM